MIIFLMIFQSTDSLLLGYYAAYGYCIIGIEKYIFLNFNIHYQKKKLDF